jgi:hypothetical protein
MGVVHKAHQIWTRNSFAFVQENTEFCYSERYTFLTMEIADIAIRSQIACLHLKINKALSAEVETLESRKRIPARYL